MVTLFAHFFFEMFLRFLCFVRKTIGILRWFPPQDAAVSTQLMACAEGAAARARRFLFGSLDKFGQIWTNLDPGISRLSDS